MHMNKLTRVIVFGSIAFLPINMNAQKSFDNTITELVRHFDVKDSIVFLQGLDTLYEAYCRENDSLYNVSYDITRRFRQDQAIRIVYTSVNQPNYKLSKEKKIWLRNQMDQMDCKNGAWCNKILDEYGFPDYDNFGNEVSDHFWNILQHVTDTTILAKGIKLMKEQVDKHQATAWEYAYLVDRLALNTCKEQTYGTQHVGLYLVPVKNPDQVDKLRASLGLGSVIDEMHADFDPNFSWEKYHQTLDKNWSSYKKWFNSKSKK